VSGGGIPALHARFVERAVAVLRDDPRLLGVGAGGSWVTGGMDEHSDVDLVIGVRPEDHAAVMAERPAIAARLGPLLAAFTGEFVGEPRLLICLYGPPVLHVDLKFVAAPDLPRRVEDFAVLWERDGALAQAMAAAPAVWPTPRLQWMEDRFWTWVHYVAAKLGRGELFEVIETLSFLRRVVLGPLAAMADGGRAYGSRRLERTAPSSLDALRRTVPAHDAASCAAAVGEAVALYRELRDRLAVPGFVRRPEAEAAAVDYLRAAGGGA
jgi:hypothetical protein